MLCRCGAAAILHFAVDPVPRHLESLARTVLSTSGLGRNNNDLDFRVALQKCLRFKKHGSLLCIL